MDRKHATAAVHESRCTTVWQGKTTGFHASKKGNDPLLRHLNMLKSYLPRSVRFPVTLVWDDLCLDRLRLYDLHLLSVACDIEA